jgi:surface protein
MEDTGKEKTDESATIPFGSPEPTGALPQPCALHSRAGVDAPEGGDAVVSAASVDDERVLKEAAKAHPEFQTILSSSPQFRDQEQDKKRDKQQDEEEARPGAFPEPHEENQEREATMVQTQAAAEPNVGVPVVSGQHVGEIYDEDSKEGSPRSRKRLIALAVVILLLVGGILVAGFCGSGACSSKNDSKDEDEEPVTPVPTLTPEPPSPFPRNATELRQAINEYLEAEDPSSTVAAQMYGFPIGKWDVSHILDFSSMFSAESNWAAKQFNEDLSLWNVSSAQRMRLMFRGASAFNQNLSTWDVSSVRDMSGLFLDAESFVRMIRAHAAHLLLSSLALTLLSTP